MLHELLTLLPFIGVWILYKAAFVGMRDRTLPPGPRTLPILGNLHQLPKERIYLRFTEWARQYGDVYSLKFGSGNVAVLSSPSTIKELLDKRSRSTAGRPSLYFAQVICDNANLPALDYGDEWRAMRRAARVLLASTAVSRAISIQHGEGSQLLFDLLRDPDSFYQHIRRTTVSIMTTTLCGKRCPRINTKEVKQVCDYVDGLTALLAPGAHPPVDLVPLLKLVPRRWAPWKKMCENLRDKRRHLFSTLMEECEARVQKKTEVGCYAEDVVRDGNYNRDFQIGVISSILEAGADTTGSTLQFLVLLLVAFPEAQRKAQREMDSVVGEDRMPVLEDIDSLPYCRALIQEVFRFRPVTPLGIPHRTIEDNKFRGFNIPQDNVVFLNTWGIYHDPDTFENPDDFNPDRYLVSEHGTRDGYDDCDFRHDYGFGSGRRICPGMHFAKNSINLITMNLIWAFGFSEAVDPLTKQCLPVDIHNVHDGISTAPVAFPCTIIPRSAKKAKMIEECFSDAVKSFEPFERELDAVEKEWLSENRFL